VIAESSRVRDILAIDVGTSGLRLGVFGPSLDKRFEARRSYKPHIYDRGKADIDPKVWWSALCDCCAEAGAALADVAVVSLSVTTPGLIPMAADGTPLAPAVLFFDARSHEQAAAIRSLVGERRFLDETCNLPVTGGSSLASILWFRDEQPDVFERTAVFGHTNSYMANQMTGRWAIDPSTTSITGLYNTARNDLTWNADILELAGISSAKLPPLMQSFDPVGTILPAVAAQLGLPADCTVLCGGNDAVLAALSGGQREPGEINLISGTCDIATVCTDRPIASPNFNVRCHVIPGRWLTFFVLNTGGEAFEWFRTLSCREMDAATFYDSYVPEVLERFLSDPNLDVREAALPEYKPYLAGSRYSLEPLTAAFSGLTLETTRDDLLLSLVRGNASYVGRHLQEVARLVPMGRRVRISGGGSAISCMLDARRRWTGDFEYVFQDQSSLLGAAMLGQIHQARERPDAVTGFHPFRHLRGSHPRS
jgi:sugar (pentulose or hexulose) kinase